MWRVTENGPPDCWITGLQDHWVAAGSREATTPTPELFGPGYCLVRGCCCEPLVAVSQGRSVGSPSGRRRRRHERRALGGACIPAVPRLGPPWYPRQRSSRRPPFCPPETGHGQDIGCIRVVHWMPLVRVLAATGAAGAAPRLPHSICLLDASIKIIFKCASTQNEQSCLAMLGDFVGNLIAETDKTLFKPKFKT